MKTVVFLPPAEEEMIVAAQYYESHLRGLGADFLTEIERATDAISMNPKAASIVIHETRRWLLRRFPFGLLYRIEENEIVIVAVMHLRRHPEYWQNRT